MAGLASLGDTIAHLAGQFGDLAAKIDYTNDAIRGTDTATSGRDSNDGSYLVSEEYADVRKAIDEALKNDPRMAWLKNAIQELDARARATGDEQPSLEYRRSDLAVRDVELRLSEIKDRLRYNAGAGLRDGRGVDVVRSETWALKAERERLEQELPKLRKKREELTEEKKDDEVSAERRAIEIEKLQLLREQYQQEMETREAQLSHAISQAQGARNESSDGSNSGAKDSTSSRGGETKVVSDAIPPTAPPSNVRLFRAGGRKVGAQPVAGEDGTADTPMSVEDFLQTVPAAFRKVLDEYGIGDFKAIDAIEQYQALAEELRSGKATAFRQWLIKDSMFAMERTFQRFFGPTLGQIDYMARLLAEFRRHFPGFAPNTDPAGWAPQSGALGPTSSSSKAPVPSASASLQIFSGAWR